MADGKIKLSYHAYCEAFNNFRSHSEKPKIIEWWNYLCQQQDLNWVDDTNQDALWATPEQARRVHMMAGPHHKAIYTAWKLNRNG